MRGFFSLLTLGLIIVGFLNPVAWVFALVSGVLAIGSAPSGRRADGKARTGGLLGDVWDDWVIRSKMHECPSCRTLIRRDATRCSHCGDLVLSVAQDVRSRAEPKTDDPDEVAAARELLRSGLADELLKFHDLKEKGAITEAEFEEQKTLLLERSKKKGS